MALTIILRWFRNNLASLSGILLNNNLLNNNYSCWLYIEGKGLRRNKPQKPRIKGNVTVTGLKDL